MPKIPFFFNLLGSRRGKKSLRGEARREFQRSLNDCEEEASGPVRFSLGADRKPGGGPGELAISGTFEFFPEEGAERSSTRSEIFWEGKAETLDEHCVTSELERLELDQGYSDEGIPPAEAKSLQEEAEREPTPSPLGGWWERLEDD